MSVSQKRPREGAHDDFRQQKKRITFGLNALHIGAAPPPAAAASASAPFGARAFPRPAASPAAPAAAPLTFDDSFRHALDASAPRAPASAPPAPGRARRRERDDAVLADEPAKAKRLCREGSRALIVYKNPFTAPAELMRRASAAAETAASDAWLARRVRSLNVTPGTQTIELDLTNRIEASEESSADEMNVTDSPTRRNSLSLVASPGSAARRRARQRAAAAKMSPLGRTQTAILMPWRKTPGVDDGDGDVEMS